MRARDELRGLAPTSSSLASFHLAAATTTTTAVAATTHELPTTRLGTAIHPTTVAAVHELPPLRPSVPTLDELVEKSRHDAIVGLQRWWRRHHGNQKRVTELQDVVRSHAQKLIRTKRSARIRAKIRELLLHAAFLYCYSASTSAAFAGERLARFTNAPITQLVSAEFTVPTTAATSTAAPERKTFYRIANAPELFAWLRGPFLALAYPPVATSSSTSQSDDGNDNGNVVFQTSRVVGGIRIGQLRVMRADCTSRVSSYFATVSTSAAAPLYCYGTTRGDFDTDVESTASFGRGIDSDDNSTDTFPFPFAGLNDTDTLKERAHRFSSMTVGPQTLPAPAFSVVLPRADATRARSVLDWMERNTYIDAHTRAIILDLSLVNVMLRHVLTLRLVVAFPASGGAVPTLVATAAPVTKSFLFDAEQLGKSAADVAVLAFYGYFLASEVLAHTGRRRKAAALHALQWSTRFGSVPRVLSLVVYVVVWLLRLAALVSFPTDLPLATDMFVSLRAFTEPLRLAQHLLALNAILVWLMLLLLLRVSRDVDVVVRTLLVAKTKLLTLLLCFAVLVVGYASALVVALGATHDARGFESVANAVRSLFGLAFAFTLGSDSDSGSCTSADSVSVLHTGSVSSTRTALLTSFVLLHACVLANLFLVVIYEAYCMARDDVERQQLRSAHRRVNLVVEIGRYAMALATDVSAAATTCCATRRAKQTLVRSASRLAVVRALSSSRAVQRSAKVLAGHVGALGALGSKLVHSVVASERSDDSEFDDDDDDSSGDRESRQRDGSRRHVLRGSTGVGARHHFRHRPGGAWPSSGIGTGAGGAVATGDDGASSRLLQGMILQLALQNESLLRSLDDVRSDVQRLTALSAMDGTSRRVLLSPASQTRLAGRTTSRKPSMLATPHHSQHSLPHLSDHAETPESGV